MADAVDGTNISRVIEYTRGESVCASSVEVRVCDNHNGQVRVEIVSDPGEGDLVELVADYLKKVIFPDSILVDSPHTQEDGRQVFAFSVPRSVLGTKVKNGDVSNQIFGCITGVFQTVRCLAASAAA